MHMLKDAPPPLISAHQGQMYKMSLSCLWAGLSSGERTEATEWIEENCHARKQCLERDLLSLRITGEEFRWEMLGLVEQWDEYRKERLAESARNAKHEAHCE